MRNIVALKSSHLEIAYSTAHKKNFNLLYLQLICQLNKTVPLDQLLISPPENKAGRSYRENCFFETPVMVLESRKQRTIPNYIKPIFRTSNTGIN